MDVLDFLNNTNYMTVNREVAREIGLTDAVFLSELIDKYKYFKSRKELTEDGWFYLTSECVEKRTTLKKDVQEAIVKRLKERGIIEVDRRGLPAKRHFKIITEKVKELINSIRISDQNDEGVAQQDAVKNRNWTREKTATPPIYSKNPKDNPVLKKKESLSLLPFGEYVKLTQKDYDDFVIQLGEEKVLSLIQQINDYICSTGRVPYKEYASTMRNWLARQTSQGVDSKRNVDKNLDNKNFANQVKSRFPNDPDIQVEKDSITLNGGPMSYEEIGFHENGFRDRVLNRLRRWNYNVNGL